MEFEIGQIFEEMYPPEAAQWCNERQDCYIEEIEAEEGVRRFKIVEILTPTEEDVKNERILNIKRELTLFDEQRIRAIAEPSVKDESTGETWLEYYNAQAANLRDELSRLEN